MIHPRVQAFFRRWAEVIGAGGTALFGLWLAAQGGIILIPLGLALAGLAGGWALLAFRRARFAADPAAPGLVELDEGRLRYLHPSLGGEVSLHDLAELKLVSTKGRRAWYLTDLYGQGLLVPLDAAGAPALFDALAALPDLSSHDLVAALDQKGSQDSSLPALALSQTTVWKRRGGGLRKL